MNVCKEGAIDFKGQAQKNITGCMTCIGIRIFKKTVLTLWGRIFLLSNRSWICSTLGLVIIRLTIISNFKHSTYAYKNQCYQRTTKHLH